MQHVRQWRSNKQRPRHDCRRCATSAFGKVIFRLSWYRILNTKSKTTPAILRPDNLLIYSNRTYQRSFEEFAEIWHRKSAGPAVTIRSVDITATKYSTDGIGDKIRRRKTLWTAIGGSQTEERAAKEVRNAVATKKESFSYLVDAVHSDLIFCLSSYRRR